MFDIQPIGVRWQLPGECIEQPQAQPTPRMPGVDVELVHHVIGPPATALPDADNLPVGLGDDH